MLLFIVANPLPPAQAHHSFAAQYDGSKPMTLRGSVARVDWVNPHAWIHLDVGKAQWMVEAGSPGVLLREGFTRETLIPGTPIIVDGYPAKTGERKMMSVRIRLAL
jgi:hypothetical protein